MKIASKLNAKELLKKIEKYSYLGTGPQNGIVGSFDNNEFNLNQVQLFRGSVFLFRPFFYGKVISTETGSEIVGEFKMNRFVKISVGIFLVSGAIGIAFLIRAMSMRPDFSWQAALILLVLYVCLAFAPSYFLNGEKAARLYIASFLKQCISNENVTLKCARLDNDRIVLSQHL